MSAPSQVTRVTSPALEAALSDAYETLSGIEGTLDKQISTQTGTRFFVSLTASEWRQYSIGMLMLERALKQVKSA